MPPPPSQSNATLLRALSWPLIMVGFLVAFIEILAKGGLVAGATFWFVFIAALVQLSTQNSSCTFLGNTVWHFVRRGNRKRLRIQLRPA
jgi:hypothetical protein